MMCATVRSSEWRDIVGRTVTGKSQVIVSTNEPLSVCRVVAMETSPEPSSRAELLVWWAGFLLRTNLKCTCHLRETETGKKFQVLTFLKEMAYHTW